MSAIVHVTHRPMRHKKNLDFVGKLQVRVFRQVDVNGDCLHNNRSNNSLIYIEDPSYPFTVQKSNLSFLTYPHPQPHPTQSFDNQNNSLVLVRICMHIHRSCSNSSHQHVFSIHIFKGRIPTYFRFDPSTHQPTIISKKKGEIGSAGPFSVNSIKRFETSLPNLNK